jgi:hypothetical protein
MIRVFSIWLPVNNEKRCGLRHSVLIPSLNRISRISGCVSGNSTPTPEIDRQRFVPVSENRQTSRTVSGPDVRFCKPNQIVFCSNRSSDLSNQHDNHAFVVRFDGCKSEEPLWLNFIIQSKADNLR